MKNLVQNIFFTKFTLFSISALLSCLFFASQTSPVHASSIYDTTWRSTNDLSLQSPSCGTVNKASEITAQLNSSVGWPQGGYWWAPNDTVRDYYQDITTGTTPGFISLVKTHQVGTNWTWVSVYAQQGSSFYSIWVNDANLGRHARIPGPSFDTTSFSGQWLSFRLNDSTCDMTFGSIGGTSVAFLSSDDSGDTYSMENIDLHFYNGATFNQNKPSGYSGPDLGTYSDSDSDGLTSEKEFEQDTSDTEKDTDNDGLGDMVESVWNPVRDDVFCKTSVSPYICAYPDPKKKDVYVEVDWMNDGTTNYKPTSTQLELVRDMFDDQDINLHFDMGEYGGGNEVATYTSPLLWEEVSTRIDYFDYKSGGNGITANFSTDRESIWHYMITGNTYTKDIDPQGSTGWASAMGSNIFIALGPIKSANSLVSEDRAIANTIAHELGHNLCLSSVRIYNEQPASCAYAGIDNKEDEPGDDYYNLEDYESVMNYRYQLTDRDDIGVVNYSDGGNVTDDHDDWGAVHSGLGKFNASHTPYVELGARNGNYSLNLDPDGNVILE